MFNLEEVQTGEYVDIYFKVEEMTVDYTSTSSIGAQISKIMVSDDYSKITESFNTHSLEEAKDLAKQLLAKSDKYNLALIYYVRYGFDGYVSEEEVSMFLKR